MNAACLLTAIRRTETTAREALAKFWDRISTREPFIAMPAGRDAVELANLSTLGPAASAGIFLSRFFRLASSTHSVSTTHTSGQDC